MKSAAILTDHLGSVRFPWLGATWRWWIGELAAMMSPRLRRRLAGTNDHLLLIVGQNGITEIVFESADRRGALGMVDLHSAKIIDGWSDLALDPIRQDVRREIVLRLPAASALRSTISLPSAAERNLRQIISFELRRQTPFKPEDILHAFQIVRRDPVGKVIFVELTVVQRGETESMIDAARSLGLEPTRVEVAGIDATETISPDLLGGQRRTQAMRGPAVAAAALTALAVLLAIIAVAIPLYRDHVAVAMLGDELGRTKALADESLRLQKEIDSRLQETGFLTDRKQRSMPVSQILDNLTKLLPDDTSLIELRIDGRAIEIAGFAASASTVIGLIDKSGSFTNPSYRSAVTQDQRTGHEQFDVAAQLATGKTP